MRFTIFNRRVHKLRRSPLVLAFVTFVIGLGVAIKIGLIARDASRTDALTVASASFHVAGPGLFSIQKCADCHNVPTAPASLPAPRTWPGTQGISPSHADSAVDCRSCHENTAVLRPT
jgi:hypothetical protein